MWPHDRLLLLLLLLVCILDWPLVCKTEKIDNSHISCPVHYERQELQQIQQGRVPYLFGGIYADRPCLNCKRGGLWSKFCSFGAQPTGQPHWDQQICSAQQTGFFKGVLSLRQGPEMLQLTPCDLWPHLRGRTLWVIG
jgi:hypothetical protein